MEAKTKKILLIAVAVIVGISVLGSVLPWIAFFAIDSSEKSKNQKIEQLISNRDYDGARQKANKLNRKDKEETLAKINKAQLSVMVVEFSLKDAEYMAQELNAMPEFFEVFENNIQSVYSKDFRGLYNLLSRYPITASYHAQLSHIDDLRLQWAHAYAGGDHSSIYEEYYYSTNVAYNTEIGRLNKLVSQVLDLAVFDENKEYLRKLLPLFKPEAVEAKRVKQDNRGYYNISYKLENNAKADALRKIKEAGINL